MRRLTVFWSACRVAGAISAAGLVVPNAAAAFSDRGRDGLVLAQYDGPSLAFGPGGAVRRRERGPLGPFTSYQGYRIDLGEAQGRIDVPSALAEVDRQIDIVERAGLSPRMLATFRAVPIRISVRFAGGGSHYSGGSEVTLGSLSPGDERPVLLHEYMHVLEYRTFPGGFRNATVDRFYGEASARGLFPPQSYMMSNAAEYFAVTASCYLNGTVARDPYTRDAIRDRQPDYYAYLSRLFGPRGGVARIDGGTAAGWR